jgi:acyl carrier protein
MQISRDDVISAIREAESDYDLSALRDDVKLVEQGLDSLSMFNILLVLTERYELGEIPESEAERLKTVNQIIEYFNKRLS